MNIQAANRSTAAEAALVEAYTAQLGDLPGDGAVLGARDILFDDLKRAGLPTRRIEAWHYTDLKTLLRAIPDAATLTPSKAVAPLVEAARIFELRQGLSRDVSAPDGVTVRAYSESLLDGTAATDLVAFSKDDAIGRINGSFVRDGYRLNVEDNVEVDRLIELQAHQGGGQSHSRFVASFGSGSKATVIERHRNSGEAAGLISSVSDLDLGEGAEVTWIIVQTQGLADTHLGQIKVVLGTNAKLKLFVINAGGKLVRQEIHVRTAGEGSDFTLRAVNLLGGESHTDVTMTLGHDVPNTTSTEVIRNVVFDRARGVFQGQIRVAPDAQKTDARMACNTLLMSDDAEYSVKPELEIFADDVQCAHGATVADIDHNHLYYLMARGIPQKVARGLLIKAFVAELVEELEDEELVEALEGVIADWLETHG
ncbi:Fe-S cluster assembly protein SufD [Agrobacterium vitis]|uniref:Fe-S cluster assembly protein SufD n=1 Tax=Agrobacterium vitis TaxID=373 RepID=A0AAE5AV12_AGRVI|nr:Fe-S cluster assembly protein SufD [Agrobacterium vitis]MUZ57144.1 Fe-S cluster assembly protein SufD [Agrobacterium vitis]MVA65453.1 Fe-S cluster assembly protein SufD [Agrobacterium vitis]MVA86478.1 Fe-S cluster assembly protein SufD [Agrobacterium vitis]